MMGAPIQGIPFTALIFTLMASALIEKDVNEGNLFKLYQMHHCNFYSLSNGFFFEIVFK